MSAFTRRQFLALLGAATKAKPVKVVVPVTTATAASATMIAAGRPAPAWMTQSVLETFRNVARRTQYEVVGKRLDPTWTPLERAPWLKPNLQWANAKRREFGIGARAAKLAAARGEREGVASAGRMWFEQLLPQQMKHSRELIRPTYPRGFLERLGATAKQREAARRWAGQWRKPKGLLVAGG